MTENNKKRKIFESASSNNDKPKNKRKVLSWGEKKQLCEFYQENPSITYRELGKRFGNIAENTVCDILKKKEKWLKVDMSSNDAMKQKDKTAKYPELENALILWMSHAASVNKSIKGDVILDKAKSFAQLLGINDFKGVGNIVRNSEVIRRSPEELINLERKKLQDIIKNYPLEDVFNCNEFVPVGGSIGENVEGSDIDSSTEITEIASI
nr:14224_t:CDS:2 [Entrophospora candida]